MTNEAGNTLPFFVTGYTPDGYYSVAQQALLGIECLFVLHGRSGKAKTAIIRQVSEAWKNAGHTIEMWLSPMHNTHLQGVVAPALQMAVIDGPACLINDARGQGAKIDLDACYHQEKMQEATIRSVEQEIEAHLASALDYTQQSKRLHRQVEAHHVRGLDFARANAQAESLIAEIFDGVAGEKRQAQVRSFLCTVWVADMDKPIDDLRLKTTDFCRSRYIIKGLAGSGKSTLSKKIAKTAVERGYAADYHFCVFDINSVDGVTIPALSTAVLDGTYPHIIDPQRPGDKIVDMLECMDLGKVDLKAVQELESQQSKARNGFLASLLAASETNQRLEAIYAECADDIAIEQLGKKLIDQIGRVSNFR